MAFVWNEFGTLKDVRKSPSLVIIENEQGDILKMSIKKYKESALKVYEKSKPLIGKSVIVRTSQNTADWSTQEWFSEIKSST
jgi:hypothetical protein